MTPAVPPQGDSASAADRLLDQLTDAVLDGSPVLWDDARSHPDAVDGALIEQLSVLAAVQAAARNNGECGAGSREFWGHLRVLEPVGRGAFGEVYRAWDTRLDREVALKLLSSDAASASPPPTIIEEGRLLARVRHPNVVTIYGAERIGDRIGLWMEFVRGRTLQEIVSDAGPLPAGDVIRLGVDLCRAVAAVHAAGLLHRDIKPQNAMMADDGRLVLMDFGTVRETCGPADAAIAGTPLYLAPEVLSGEQPTVASDLYSLGVLLYYLATGTYPVRAETLAGLRRAHARGERPSLDPTHAAVPPALGRVIERTVDPVAARRYPSADALAADLAAIGTPRRRLTPASVAGGAITVLLLVSGGFHLQDRWQVAPPAISPPGPGHAATPATRGAIPLISLPGEKYQLAISPDGGRLAFVWAPADEAYLYVSRLGGEGLLRLSDAPGTDAFPAWSPDGRFIAFRQRLDGAGGSYVINIVPVAGGASRTVWRGELKVGRGLDWSPDGAQLVASARTAGNRAHRLLRVSIATGETDWLTSPPDDADDSYPVFSPDGQAVAFVRSAGLSPGIYLLRHEAREPVRLMAATAPLKRLTWASDGRSLVFASGEGPGHYRLSRVSVPGGQVELVPGAGQGATEPSVARGVGHLVFLQETLDRNLYRARLEAGAPTVHTQLTGTMRTETHPDVSPDASRVAFVSDRGGYAEVWTADPHGEGARPVTSLESFARHPRFSPDGQRLAFVGLAARADNHDVYVVETTGGHLRRLTHEASTEQWPTWSADGQWIYFTSDRTGSWEIWKAPAAGGTAARITTSGALKAWESRDGRFVLYADDTRGIWRMPVAGGVPERLFALPAPGDWGGEWAPADGGVFFLNAGNARGSLIERFDFRTRRITTVFTLPGLYDTGSGFSISRDGTTLVYPQRDVARSEIMLMHLDR